MLSRVVGLNLGELPGFRPRSIWKTALWLPNDPWRSSILATNRQAAITNSILISWLVDGDRWRIDDGHLALESCQKSSCSTHHQR